MLKYVDTEVTFAELPNEISLCINISQCPYRCAGCHSKHLRGDIGEPLTPDVLKALVGKNEGITAICFLGGDVEPQEIDILAEYIKKNHPNLKVGWYSGNDNLTVFTNVCNFDYIKLGRYKKKLGGLTSPTTNQKMYRVDSCKLIDITCCYSKG